MIINRSLVFVLATLTASVAFAQNSNTPRAGMEEITTTARKAEENIQDVPIAVSAFTSDEMTRRNMRELEDVALATPGFAFEDYGGGFGVPVIRGGTQLRIQDLDQTTSVYLDGIYIPRQYAVDLGTVGFERIEIVKGPQSALFGRNAFLGAVNYVSGGPGSELDTQVIATVGSDDRYDISGEISGPIIGDRLGGRVVVAYTEFDGTWDNEHPNAGLSYGKRGTEDNLAGFENTTIGVNLEAQPIDALGIELDYYHVERFQEQNAGIRVESGPGDTNCSNGRFYCGEIPDTFSPLPGGSPPGTKSIADPRGFLLDVETDFVHAGVRYDFSDKWAAVYQFGYIDTEVVSAGAGDRDPLAGSFNFLSPANSPVNYINGTPGGTNEFTSHEFRVEYSSGQWTAMLGGFTSEIDDLDVFDFVLAPFLGTETFNIDPATGYSGVTFVFPITRAATVVDTNAVFGRVSWESSDARWRIGAEARYQDEEKTLDSNTRVTTDPIFKDSWTQFTPRFTVDYRIDDDRMLYGSVAKGAKSGGFNNTVFDESQRSFDPDENWTVELGSKNDFLDGRLRLNAAIYFTDWQDLQINSSPIGLPPGGLAPAVVDNTGGAEIWGIEIDGAWIATDMFSFDYAFSYAATEFTSDSISARAGLTGACDDIVCPADGSIGGNEIPRQPALQLNVGTVATGNLGSSWDWYGRVDVSHQSKQYIDEFNLAWVPDRTLVNARFELSTGPWTAALWARNLFDQEYAANAFFIQTATSTSYVPIFGEKRAFGLTVTFDLGAGNR